MKICISAFSFRCWYFLPFLLSGLCHHSNAEEALVHARFRVFSTTSSVHELFFYTLEEGQEEAVLRSIKIRQNDASARQNYRGRGTRLKIFCRNSDSEKESLRVCSELNFPDGKNGEYLILLIPEAEGATKAFRSIVISEQEKLFPFRYLWFHNLTDLPIALEIGSTRLGLKPNSRKLQSLDSIYQSLENEGAYGHGTIPLRAAVRTSQSAEDEKWRMAYKNRWFLHRSGRHHIFILPSGKNGIRVFRMSETLG